MQIFEGWSVSNLSALTLFEKESIWSCVWSKPNGSKGWLPTGFRRQKSSLPLFLLCYSAGVCVREREMQCSRDSITPSEVWMTRFTWSGGRQSHIRLWWMVWECFQWWICRTGPGPTVTQWAARNCAGITSSVVSREIFSSCCRPRLAFPVFTLLITDRDDAL